MGEHRGVVITAGFNKSKSAIAIAELLRRNDIKVKGFTVVNPYSFSRLRCSIKKRGINFIINSIPRLLGTDTNDTKAKRSPLAKFLDDNTIKESSIKKWASMYGADYLSVSSLNDKNVSDYLQEENPQWLIYSGGGIIRDHVIKVMDGRILNAHLGPLPEIRGMNATEWSILLDERKDITIHLIDHGIDTGKIIKNITFNISSNDDISSIRDEAKVKGIEGLVEIAAEKNLNSYNLSDNHDDYRQCYILSSTMQNLLKKKLELIQSR